MKRLRLFLSLLLVLGATLPAWAEFINGDLTVAGYINYCAATGTTNTYACSLPSAITQYRTGGCWAFLANTTNTGAATINLNTLGAKTIKKFVAGSPTDVVAGDIGAGQIVAVCYDGTVMQLRSGAGGGVGGGTVTSVGGSGPMTGGPITSAGTFGFDSSQPLFLKDGATTDLTCGSGANGKAQVMDNGEFQYCDGAGVAILHTGVPTQSGLTWNVTPSTCTGDASSGKLTVNGSNQIICAPDQGGAGGSGDITAVGTATTGDAFTDATPGQRLTYAPMAAPSTPAAGKATGYVDATSKNFALKNDEGTVNHGVKSSAAIAGQFVTGVEDDGDLTRGAPSKSDVGLDQVDNTSDVTKNAATATLTNHEVAPRPVTCAPSAGHILPNANITDYCESYVLTSATTIDDPTGTSPHPYNHQRLVFVFKSAAPQALSWGSAYSAVCRLPLPRATTGDGVTYDRVVVEYTQDAGKWCPVQSTAHPVPPRPVTCIPSANHIQPNADTTDYCESYSIGAATTIDNPIATAPRNHQTLTFVMKSAASWPLIWDTAYSAECNLPLPTVTMGDGATYEHFLFEYNLITTKWCPLASTQTPPARIAAFTSSATATTLTCPQATSDQCELVVTGATGAITVAVPGPGTPTNGQELLIAVRCTTVQTITWNAIFIDSATFTRPTSCPADPTTWLTTLVRYSTPLSKWQVTRGEVSGGTYTLPGTVVQTNQANTYGAFAQNFGTATSLVLPKAAAAAPTADGDARFDTTQHIPVYGENGLLTSSPTRTLFVADNGSTNNGGSGDVGHSGTTITLPSGYLLQHRSLRICVLWRFTTPSSAATLQLKMQLGGIQIYSAGAVSSPGGSKTNNTFGQCHLFVVKDPVGGSAATVTGPIFGQDAMLANVTNANSTPQPVNLPTNTALTLVLISRWGTATAGNAITPDLLTVEALN